MWPPHTHTHTRSTTTMKTKKHIHTIPKLKLIRHCSITALACTICSDHFLISRKISSSTISPHSFIQCIHYYCMHMRQIKINRLDLLRYSERVWESHRTHTHTHKQAAATKRTTAKIIVTIITTSKVKCTRCMICSLRYVLICTVIFTFVVVVVVLCIHMTLTLNCWNWTKSFGMIVTIRVFYFVSVFLLVYVSFCSNI